MKSLNEILLPLIRRLQSRTALHWGALGLAVSGAFSLILGLLRLWGGIDVPLALVVGSLVLGPVVGLLAGRLRPRSAQEAAHRVDAHFALKDGVITTLSLLERGTTNAVEELQVSSTLTELEGLPLREAIAIDKPRGWWLTAGVTGLAITVLLWPMAKEGSTASESEGAIPVVLEQADELEEQLDALEEFAKEQGDRQLEAIMQELREVPQELREQGVTLRDALQRLSEVEAALSQVASELNEKLVASHLSEMGRAMKLSDSFDDVSKALEEGRYDDAAEALSQTFDRQEKDTPQGAKENEESRRAEERKKERDAERQSQDRFVGEALAKVARGMGEAGLEEWGEETGKLAEQLKKAQPSEGDCQGACSSLSQKLSEFARQQEVKKKLQAGLSELAEAKGRLGEKSESPGKGKKKGSTDSLAGGQTQRDAKNESTRFGMSEHGGLDGDPTSMDTERKLERLKGQKGTGPSQFETERSTEGEGEAARQYRDVYAEYKKISDAVLEAEKIPLGHRETIRRYFERIRPRDQGDSK